MRNGALRIIDRKKNIFKLSQGEYVSPEKIETILTRCSYIEEIFVYGDSHQNYLVAVVFPEMAWMRQFAKKIGLGKLAIGELC